MTESQLVTAPVVRAPGVHLARRMLANPAGLFSIVVLVIVTLVAVFADVLTPMNPSQTDISNTLAPPGGAHVLGTDTAGRDVLSRLLVATRFSMMAALWAVTVAAVIGISSGLVAGYYQKWFKSSSIWAISVVQSLPGIVVLIAARAVVGPSMWLLMAVFGLLLTPAFYQVAQVAVAGVRNELFVDAARVAGVGDASIIGRHILAVVRAPLIILTSLLLGIAIAIQSGLDFLGLGDTSMVTWGQMLADAFSRMYQAPFLLIWPSVAMALTTVALVLFGNALRDELEQAGTGKRRRRTSTHASIPSSGEPPLVHAENSAVRRAAHDSDLRGVVLEVKDLVVGYEQRSGEIKTVVDGVSITIRKGEVHGLVGESGSGKTQTAWSILRLLPEGGEILSGSVFFDGEDLALKSLREMRRVRGGRIAYVPQEPMSNLDPSFTVGSQLVEPMTIALGIGKKEAKRRALALLARVGIADPERTFAAYPHEISGGMAQRVLIAGAVCCEADLIIADEPTTALDVTVQAEILDLLRELQRDLGVSILLVTHNLGVVADLCDRVSVMRHGRVIETGPVESIFANPQHPYTTSLLNATLDDGEARGSLDHVDDGGLVEEGIVR